MPDTPDLWDVTSVVAEQLTGNIVYNAAANWQTIAGAAQRGEPVCIDTLPRVRDFPALVLGSGPSLDEMMPWIDRWPGAVFCGPSQCKIMDKWGREPDYVVAIDTNEVVARQLAGPLYSTAVLITHQAIDPSVLAFWRWQRRFVRLNTAGAKEAYPWLRRSFSAHGCTVNACIQLAAWLGYSPIVLAGVDFSYPAHRSRATDYHWRGVHAYEPIPPKLVTDPEIPGDPPTTVEMRYYSILTYGLWKLMRAQLYSCSSGILDKMPHITPQEAVERSSALNWDLDYPYDEIARIVDSITVPQGLYVDAEHNRLEKAGSFAQRAEELDRELSTVQMTLDRWRRGPTGSWTRRGDGE